MTARMKLLLLAAATPLLAACVTQPAGMPPTTSTAPPAQEESQAEAVAAEQLEKNFQEAAKGYKLVQKDGKTLYCKREKVIGSTIPTMQCMTEAQLRLQVENMEELRGRMRNSAKCTLGRSGGGGGACGGS